MIYGNLPASHWEKNTRPTAFVCVFGWFPSWLLHLASYLNPSHSKKNLSNHICLPDGRFLLFALICQQKQLTLDSMQPPARIMPGILVSLLRSSHTVALTLTHPHMHWLIHTKRERERKPFASLSAMSLSFWPGAGERFFIWQMLIKRPTGLGFGSGFCVLWADWLQSERASHVCAL